MASKGNGVAKTNELLVQILGELSSIGKEQVGLRKIAEEQGRTLREHGQILRGHGQTLERLESGVHQLNENMAHIAHFVGETRARQDREIQEIRARVEALERRAA